MEGGPMELLTTDQMYDLALENLSVPIDDLAARIGKLIWDCHPYYSPDNCYQLSKTIIEEFL
jgi:hypothetical protein